MAAAALALLLAFAPQAAAETTCGLPDSCQEPARAGEVSLVFLGDSGYGQGGASEWGSHAQAQVATMLGRICPRPDLVFFLGDNVYWKGSPDLFGPRFDTVYAQLFDAEQRRVHAALGNHDVKGCQVAPRSAFAPGESCADALVRLLGDDVDRGTPPGEPATSPDVDPGVLERARAVHPLDCPPAFDRAYEQRADSGLACYATQALQHTAFGYGIRAGQPLRYYTIDEPPADEPVAGRPRVRVLVTDSNTLRSGPGGDAGEGDELVLQPDGDPKSAPVRTDRLQALWLENQLRTAGEDAWTFVALHHAPYTPKACVFKVLGKCIGGHGDDFAVRNAMFPAWERPSGRSGVPATYEPHRPDIVFAAHNHFYARTRPIDASGDPAGAPGQGIRHIVTGGGGGPLYRMRPLHSRYAAGGSYHHFTYVRLRGDEAFLWVVDQHGAVRDSFCFRRREHVDRCIARGGPDDAEIACGDAAPVEGCPLP